MAGTIFLIPCTLGDDNLSNIPVATQNVVCELDYFLVENAKSARKFLTLFPLTKPIQEIEIIEFQKEENILPLLKPIIDGVSCGVISEAGCPCIADPGAVIVEAAHKQNITVSPLVGPSSILLALMGSGLDGQSFQFIGYLPRQDAERKAAIQNIERESKHKKQSIVFMDTPYRGDNLLNALLETCQNETKLCIARNVSLANQSIKTASISFWKQNQPILNKDLVMFVIQA